MAENKKSFVAYCDWIDTFEALPDDKAGQLAKHLFRYVNDKNPESDDILINAVFANIKQTLKRDLRKYDKIRIKRSEAGKASAESRKQTPTNSTSVKSVEQTSTNSTVSDSVSDSVSDILKKKQNKFKEEVKEYKKYDLEMLKAFYMYWSEPTKNKTKMRKEIEKTWDTERRLISWFNRSQK